jgi:hypothetical protein
MTTRQFIRIRLVLAIAVAIAAPFASVYWMIQHPGGYLWPSALFLFVPAAALYVYRNLACPDCGYPFGDAVVDIAFPPVARRSEFRCCGQCGADLDRDRHDKPAVIAQRVTPEAEIPVAHPEVDVFNGADPSPTFEWARGGIAVAGYSVTWLQLVLLIVVAGWLLYPFPHSTEMKHAVAALYPSQRLVLLESRDRYSSGHATQFQLYLLLPSLQDVQVAQRDDDPPTLSPPNYEYSIYLGVLYAWGFLWPPARRFLGDGRRG